MRARLLTIVTVTGLAMTPWSAVPANGGQRPLPECHEWRECSQLALDARARGQYERFHDLAWRAVQTGPPNDPALMYLLARAQSLSGRSRDALIMLRRLADRAIVTDAATDPDLDAARRLPGWQDVQRAMNRVAAPASNAPPAVLPSTPPVAALTAPIVRATPPRVITTTPIVRATPPAVTATTPAGRATPPAVTVTTPAGRATPPAVTATTPAGRATPPAAVAARPVVRNLLRFEPRPSEEVSRFSAEPFVASGLAYDAVSRRFLFGDAVGRRLFVVGERFNTAVDLVRAASAQFQDVTAFEIDTKRGDLWVTSTSPDGSVGAIHRLQLISGRPIALVKSPEKFRTVRLIDVAIATNGTVVVLDGVAPQIFQLRPGMRTLDELISLNIAAPTSIAAAVDDRTAFVAHRDGIIRLDLQLRTAAPVTAPEGITLGGFERIRWHRNALIGVQVLPDGSRRVVRLQLNRTGSVTDATAIGALPGSDAGPTFLTVSSDDVYYLVTQQTDSPVGAKVMSVIVNRIRLP